VEIDSVGEALTKTEVVSSELEPLILVDENDEEVGFLDKTACHDGSGMLHRAFSLFIFNPAGELLIHQRASNKRLWPDHWSNSCCSHPRRGESMVEAVTRRLEQELGLRTELQYLYKFEYRANYHGLGSEHELCSVYAGHTNAEPVINTTEIRDWRWVDPTVLRNQLVQESERFTPWFQMEFKRIEQDFPEALESRSRF
jgi:isopentenyl-diphosphate delta-isomerase